MSEKTVHLPWPCYSVKGGIHCSRLLEHKGRHEANAFGMRVWWTNHNAERDDE